MLPRSLSLCVKTLLLSSVTEMVWHCTQRSVKKEETTKEIKNTLVKEGNLARIRERKPGEGRVPDAMSGK